MYKKLSLLLIVLLFNCSSNNQTALSSNFVGCKITLEEGLKDIQETKSSQELDFEIRIVKEITANEDCLGMILGTNVPQGENLSKIDLLDLVVGISDPNLTQDPEEQPDIVKTEYELYLSKLDEIDKAESNLIETSLYNQASFTVELEGYTTISHIGIIESLSTYEYLFSEQCGKIHAVLNQGNSSSSLSPAEGLNAPTILDLSDNIDCDSEKGLHTFSQVEVDGKEYVLVSYLRNDQKYILSLFEILDASTLSRNEIVIVEFGTSDSARVHFGGKLITETNSSITLCLGDLNSPGNSAKFDTPWGKVLNISNLNLTKNKIVDINDERIKVIAFGLRNPWSCFLSDDDLVVPDVGNIQWEEYNIISQYKAVKEPVFFGWPWEEGYFSANYTNTPVDEERKNLLISLAVDPIFTYPHANGYCAIIGGVSLLNNPVWKNFTLVGDFCTGTIWAIQYKSNRAYRVLDSGRLPLKITTIQETLGGQALIGTTKGEIIRLTLP